MAISSSEILAITGIISIIIGIISIIISYLNNKATLKQSEKNWLLQLSHEDRKRALFDLNNIIKNTKNYYDLKKNLQNFLNSVHGQFVPINIRDELEKGLNEIESFCYQKSPYPEHQAPSDKEMEKYWKEQEDYEKSEEERKKNLDPVEKFDEEFSGKFSSFKGNMIGKINSNLRKPEP